VLYLKSLKEALPFAKDSISYTKRYGSFLPVAVCSVVSQAMAKPRLRIGVFSQISAL
jgi:hypothetical protein